MGKYENTPRVLKKRLIVSYIYRVNFSNCAPIFLPSPPLPTGTLLNKPALAYFCVWPTEFNSFGGRLFTGAEATMGGLHPLKKMTPPPIINHQQSPQGRMEPPGPSPFVIKCSWAQSWAGFVQTATAAASS